MAGDKPHAITITRQFGSRGREIGQIVAEKLGYTYYDRDIIEMSAAKMNKHIDELTEYDGHEFSKYGKMMSPLGFGSIAKQNKLFQIQKEIIVDLAKTKDCVIVGRCSDFILKEAKIKRHLAVYIYAPYDSRFDTAFKMFGLTGDAVQEHIYKIDKARGDFYKRYTGENFSSPKYRDLMINSSLMDIEDIADVIVECAKKKFKIK